MFEVLKRLEESGDLATLVKCGLIKPQARLYFQIFEYYQQQAKKRFTSRGDATDKTMERFKVCRRTVYYAVNFCKKSCTN